MPRTNQPYSMALHSNGLVYLANGTQPVQRWDGLATSPEDAGFADPSGTPALAASGTGSITGELYCCVRFMDKYGYVSNISPVSAKMTVGTQKTITDATNAVPSVITSAAHGYTNGQVVRATGIVGNSNANGLRKVASATVNTFELTDMAGFPVPGNGEYRGGGSVRLGCETINYTNLPVPTDAKVVRRQVLRNKHGDLNTFYVDIDTTDIASTSLSSTNTDALLVDAVAAVDTDGDDLVIARCSEPPDTKRVIVPFKGRLFALVDLIYTDGAAIVTNGSATVTGIWTEWTSEMAGRAFLAKGATKFYVISSVNEGAQTLTLTVVYAGTTSQYAEYGIHPAVDTGNGTVLDKNVMRWSEADDPINGYGPDSWHPDSGIRVPEEPGAGELTGGMPMNSSLYILAEHRMYRLSMDKDPGKDGSIFPSHHRGCVNHRCWCYLDGVAYLMDRAGLYSLTGPALDPLSSYIQDLFDYDPDALYQINWDVQDTFHCAPSPHEEVIRWFVALGTDKEPFHAITFNIRTQRPWLERFPFAVRSSCLGVRSGWQQSFLGVDAARFMAAGLGTLDAPETGTLRGTVTSADANSLVDNTAAFGSALAGCSVTICSGTGRGQTRLISKVVNTQVFVVQAWTTTPDSTSVYQIGGVAWTWRSGWFRGIERDSEIQRAAEVLIEPTDAASTLDLRLFYDQSLTADQADRTQSQADGDGIGSTDADAYHSLDTTKASGYFRKRIPWHREAHTEGRRSVSLELTGVPNTDRQKVLSLAVEGFRK